MRSEIGVHPWAKWFIPYLNGEELRHCRMADEELGCAEVYQVDERGHRRPEWGMRRLFGEVKLVPWFTEAQRIKDHPEQAQAIWNAWERDLKDRIGWSDEEVRQWDERNKKRMGISP